MDLVELGEMVAELRERLEQGVPSKTVFCHNDLQVGLLCYFRPEESASIFVVGGVFAALLPPARPFFVGPRVRGLRPVCRRNRCRARRSENLICRCVWFIPLSVIGGRRESTAGVA